MCGKNETKIKREDAGLIAELSRYMSIGENKWLLKLFGTRKTAKRERERGEARQ